MSDFVTLYPGVLIEKEKAVIEKWIAEFNSWEERGQIDIQALIHGRLPKDTPGVGPVMPVTEAMVRYNNKKYDPDNPVLNDADYARKLGYRNIFACLTFVAYDDYFLVAYPTAAYSTMFPADLNHSVTSYRPIYPGDTLYLVLNSGQLTDLTQPEGSIYRTMAMQFKGVVYNQNGEKVSDVIFRSTRNIRIYKEGKAPPDLKPRTWNAPDWLSRPAHYYTDDDWETIKDIWSKEKRQGAVPRYYEDVKIGDEPTWTADGPILVGVRPTAVHGMGTGGSRTMRKEVMDPVIFKTMIRGEKDGIYRLPSREDYIPAVPDVKPAEVSATPNMNAVITAAVPGATEPRMMLINFNGRDVALRHINNWMGDRGWISNIRWSIMEPTAHQAFGRNVPINPQAERFLEKIPRMKGKHVIAHGVTGDLAIVKSYVYDKAIRNGEFFVELAWWVETIDGVIWQEGGATIKLPSKNAK